MATRKDMQDPIIESDDSRIRLSLTPATHAWLAANKRMTGEEKASAAAKALHQIALQKLREATVLLGAAKNYGVDGAGVGKQGPEWASSGFGDFETGQEVTK